jgi:hypothetical protein
MNERLKELAFEAGFTITPCGLFEAEDTNLERFADLVRQDERASCTKLLDDFVKTGMVPVKDTWRMGVMAAANAVRDKK